MGMRPGNISRSHYHKYKLAHQVLFPWRSAVTTVSSPSARLFTVYIIQGKQRCSQAFPCYGRALWENYWRSHLAANSGKHARIEKASNSCYVESTFKRLQLFSFKRKRCYGGSLFDAFLSDVRTPMAQCSILDHQFCFWQSTHNPVVLMCFHPTLTPYLLWNCIWPSKYKWYSD